MQQSRRNRINVDPNSTLCAADKAGDELHDANVTVLGPRVNRRAGGICPQNLSTATQASVDVVVIAPDRRGSLLSPKHNHLLAALSTADYAQLVPHLESVHLPCGRVVCEANSNAEHVYFLTSGIVSMMYELKSGTCLEVGHTGNDGVVGVAVFMGGGATTSRAVVRNAGYGYRLRAEKLKSEFESNPRLRQLLLRYAQVLITQMAQAAVCHSHHQLEQQLCRLLLASTDRLPSDDLVLTHDMMADLLGVRRESITAAAGRLQSAGLIRYHRGVINVLNRSALAARVCECYAVVKTELDRLMPQAAPVARAPAFISRSHSGSGAISFTRSAVVGRQKKQRL